MYNEFGFRRAVIIIIIIIIHLLRQSDSIKQK